MDAALPAEKKKYIEGELSPLLDEMMAETIRKMPGDPKPFMLEWLENKKVFLEDQALTNEEREALSQENNQLHDSVQKSKHTLHETVKVVADEKNDEEEAEEEEDDAEDEPPPGWGEQTTTKVRQSVSAEAYGEWNQKKAFTPPVIAKTDVQKERLHTCLAKSFLFCNLEENDFQLVIGAMAEVLPKPKERVINQGDDGDFLFVIEKGQLDCVLRLPDGTEKIVKTCEEGDVFGELALLYNCPRAASVESKGECILWRLDRDTFNSIVKEAAQKKRTRYDAFLAKVPLLASMDAYERSQLADALQVENVADGATIVQAGDVGDKFFIVEEGQLEARKDDTVVMSYGAGDYFGELALIRNQPRAATVMSKGPAKLLTVDSKSFKRLLNVRDLMDRSNAYA